MDNQTKDELRRTVQSKLVRESKKSMAFLHRKYAPWVSYSAFRAYYKTFNKKVVE